MNDVKLHKNRIMRMTLDSDVSRYVDAENREAEFTLSSEQPIEDWPGEMIVLEHSNTAVDLTRLLTAAPLLFNHNRDSHLGRVIDAKIEGKKLNVRVKFGNGAMAREKFQDVQDGILREVSVSAKIHEIKLDQSEEGGVDTYRAIKWEPLEASLVTVPADISVGIDRSGKSNADEFITISRKEKIMAKDQETKIEYKTDPAEITRSQNEERERVASIHRLASKQNIKSEVVESYVNEGKSLESFQRHVLDNLGASEIKTPMTEELGLSRKEKKQYSLLRGIQNQIAAQTNGTVKDGIEREVSDAISKKIGRQAKGFFVPLADLEVSRDLSAGVDAKGGYTVQTDVLGSSLIELLRNRMKVNGLGARSLSGLQGDVAIPKADGGATAYWLAEAAAVTPSDQNFDQIALTPKRLAAATAYTKQLLAQSSIDVEGFVRNDLMSVLAIAKDLAALEGTGAGGQPTGILNTTGINTVTFGAAPTWAKVVEFETAVATDNADVSSMNYLTTPAVRGAWKTTEKATNTGKFLWDGNDMPVNGYGADVTNQISGDKVFFGDFSQLLIADWDGLDIVVDPYSLSLNGQIRIVMQHLTDIAVRHAVSFAVSTDSGAQ